MKSARRALWIGIAVVCVARPAIAQESSGWLPEQPLEWMPGDYDVTLGGFAGGAVSHSWQQGGPSDPGGYERTGASGEIRTWVRAQRTLDNGIVFGARTDLLLLHDRLSGDIYGNDVLERLFAFVQTGFGRVEIGEVDGAAYALALTGPEIDPQVNLEQRTISLFRDPATGRDFGQFFKQVTAVQTSSNFAKFNYLSPRLVGVQIGASFTPETVRSPLPFTGNPQFHAQENLWEAGINYTGYLAGIVTGLSAGYAQGNQRNSTAQGENLYDWSAGAEFSDTIDEVKLTVGGAYRGTNAWLLNAAQVFRGAATGGEHFSATAEYGSWRLGAETSSAHAAGPVDYAITGDQTSLGYAITPTVELSGGWQWYHYARNTGSFYNGLPYIHMNAGYLGLSYHL